MKDEVETKKKSHVGEQLTALSKSIDSMGVAIDSLESHLIPCLRESTPTKEKADDSKESYAVPLAHSIRQNRRRLEELTAQIQTINNRIEL